MNDHQHFLKTSTITMCHQFSIPKIFYLRFFCFDNYHQRCWLTSFFCFVFFITRYSIIFLRDWKSSRFFIFRANLIDARSDSFITDFHEIKKVYVELDQKRCIRRNWTYLDRVDIKFISIERFQTLFCSYREQRPLNWFLFFLFFFF